MNENVLTQMQSHKWAMDPKALETFLCSLVELPPGPLVAALSVAMPKKKLQVIAGTAQIRIGGILLKSVPGWMRLWGFDATGYDEIIEQINEALADATVTAIRLNVSSPGGMVAGGAEAADAILKARDSKLVTAWVEDLAASAAYWLASQAKTITAGRTAEIGSIGVYSVYFDWTGFDEKMGIKTVVIRSGEHKAMGVDAITGNQIAVVQEIIDGLADQFVASVAKGRGRDKEKMADLATGRLWLAEAALGLGLIDAIGGNNTNYSTIGDSVMETNQTTIQAAADVQAQVAAAGATARQQTEAESKKRLKDLKAAFPGDLAFAIEQFEAGATVIEAKAAYSDILAARLKAKTSAGAEALASGDSVQGGENFITLGKQMARDEKIPLGLAYKKLARQRPELHKAYKQSLGL